MAAATAVPSSLVSDILGNANFWTAPDPNFDAILALVGGASTAN